MRFSRVAPITVAIAIVVGSLVFAVSQPAPAKAYPNKQVTCSGCHSGTPSGTVSAVPDAASPSPSATYHVAISIGLSASGMTGYWIANSDAGGSTGTSTGVYGGPASQTAWQATMTAPGTPGTYYYKVFCVRGPNDNTGQAKAATYSITVASGGGTDTTAPATTASGAANNGWYGKAVTVTLTATDNTGGSGVATIVYSIDGGTPVTVHAASVDVTVPASGTVNGPHTLDYHASDVTGNGETGHTLTVNLDTVGPTTKALANATVKRGKKATLRYEVDDTGLNAGTATPVIQVKKGAKVVKTIKPGARTVNTALAAKFTCKLAKGKYTFSIKAKDKAGNAQTTIGVGKLVVK